MTLRPWLCLLIVFGGPWVADANDWLGFRGSDGAGYVTDGPAPTHWTAESGIAWKRDLPGRGLSSPIVVGDLVVVTAASGPRQERLHVLAYDAGSGNLRWGRQFTATGRTVTHPKTCNAAPTPTSDGERIFAFYSSNDLLCLDLQGRLLWYRGLMLEHPNVSNSLGMCSSLRVAGATLIAQAENDTQSLTFGVDKVTGETKWQLDRPRKANWTSPSLQHLGDQTLVLLQSSQGIAAIHPETGATVWNYADGASTIPSSAVLGAKVFVPSHGLTALQVNADQTSPSQLWRADKLGPGTASPTLAGDKVYVLNRAGVLLCAAMATGETLWQLRLAGPFGGSPVINGNTLYAFNETGGCSVVNLAAEKGELLAENTLADTILCTPALSRGAVYVRSDQRLWKIANSPAQ